MGVRDVSAYGDSKLVIQQITGESQCLDEILNSYRDRCLDIMRSLDSFCIYHIPRENNKRASTLDQCASCYEATTDMFWHHAAHAALSWLKGSFTWASRKLETGRHCRTQGTGHRPQTCHKMCM
jgi:ribonuclease HI